MNRTQRKFLAIVAVITLVVSSILLFSSYVNRPVRSGIVTRK